MAALAANASAACELLAGGIRTDFVLRGLTEGEEFCLFLDKGAKARTQTERFSAAGLAAGEFVALVSSTDVGKDLAERVPFVLEQVKTLRKEFSVGIISRSRLADVESLRNYFYHFARALSHQEALRERLARDLESADT